MQSFWLYLKSVNHNLRDFDKTLIDCLLKNSHSFTYQEIIELQATSEIVGLNRVYDWAFKVKWKGMKRADLFNNTKIFDNIKTVIFNMGWILDFFWPELSAKKQYHLNIPN